MPTIPGLLQPASTDVLSPSVPVPAGTALAEATQRLGATVAQSSLAILDKVKQSEAIDASSQAFFTDRYASEDKITQLKLKYPDGYMTDENGAKVQNPDSSYRTITQEYRDWANSRYQDNQQAMPTEMAKSMYNARAGQYFNDSMIKVRGDELVLRAQSFANTQADQLQYGSGRLVDVPDVNSAYQLSDQLSLNQKAQEGHLLSADQVHDNTMKLQSKIGEDLFLGMYNSVLAEPKKGSKETRNAKIDYALSVLKGQDPDSQRRQQSGMKTISDMMAPEQKAKAEAELLRLRDVAEKLDISDWHSRMKTAADQIDLETRNPGNISMRQAIPFGPLYKQGFDLYQAGKLTDFEFTQAIGALVAKDASRAIFTSPTFLLASPEQKNQFIDQAVNLANTRFKQFMSPELQAKAPFISGTFNKEITKNLQDLAKTTDDTAHQDFVKFGQFSPDVKSKTVQLEQSQSFSSPQVLWKTGSLLKKRNDAIESLGNAYFGAKSPDFRYIQKGESEQMGGFLRADITNYSQAADSLVALHDADPRRYASIIDQMIRDKTLTPEWRLATVVPSRAATEDLVRTIKGGETIRENAMKAITGNQKYKPEDFEVAAQTYAGPYLSAMTSSNTDSPLSDREVQLMRNVIVTKAMNLYQQENGARTPQQYIKDATDQFVGSRFQVVQNESTLWGRMTGQAPSENPSYYLIPKFWRGQALTNDQLAAGTFNGRLFLQQEQLKKFGAVPPKGLPPEIADHYYETVQKTGRFVNAGDGQNYRVEWKDPTHGGSYYPVFTAQKDRNGKPVPLLIPMEKLITPYKSTPKSFAPQPSPTPSDKAAPQKGFWQNLLEKMGEAGSNYTKGL